MVFTTLPLLVRNFIIPKPLPGPDRFWKRRKILKFAAHFIGRSQNCYSIAIKRVIRALTYATKSRKNKPEEQKELRLIRLQAACQEHGFELKLLKKSLQMSDILLNNKILVDLAVWEPRTFKCITDFAWNIAKSENLKGIDELGNPPSGVLLKPVSIK